MAWYNSSWLYRLPLTSDNTLVSSSFKGLAFDLSGILDSTFWNNVKNDGGDIRITESDGTTEIARDVVSIDTINQTGVIRFDTSGISTITDTTYYIYFGNSGAVHPAPNGTYGQYNAYDNNIKTYYPFEINANDRSFNNFDLDPINNPTYTTGIIGNAINLNGSNQYGNYPSSLLGGMTELTIETLVNLDSTSGVRTISNNWASTKNEHLLRINNGALQFYLGNTIGQESQNLNITTISANQSYHIVVNYDGANITVYVNNVEELNVAFTGTVITGNRANELGRYGSAGYFDGLIDEFLVLSRSSNADEVSTRYNNLLNMSSFWSLGNIEQEIETLNFETLSITNTFNDIDFVNTFILNLETLSTTNTFNDIDFVNEFLFNLETLSTTNTFNDIEFISADIFELDILTITNTFNDIDFVSTYIENLETLTTTNTFNDIDFVNTYVLNINTFQITNTFNDILILEGISDLLELDILTITNTFNDIEFIVINPLLINARKALMNSLNFVGEQFIYRKIEEVYNSLGSLIDRNVETFVFTGKMISGDKVEFQTDSMGEHTQGSQYINVGFEIPNPNGQGFIPRIGDEITTMDGTKTWRIYNRDESRMFGGVFDNKLYITSLNLDKR